MATTVHLSMHGMEALNETTRSELLVLIRRELDPLAAKAGVRLIVSITGRHRGDLNLDFDSESPPGRICGNTVVGEDGTGSIWVKAHAGLRVCGVPIPKTGKRDTRRFLTNDRLMGRALANTALHELGHFIGDFDHSSDPSNYMITGQPPVAQRTVSTQRVWWAGPQHFSPEQQEKIVQQLKLKEWLGDIQVNSK